MKTNKHDGKTTIDTCPICDGRGKDAHGIATCPVCKGTGKVRVKIGA